jgi:hypothetical protein
MFKIALLESGCKDNTKNRFSKIFPNKVFLLGIFL